MKPPILAIDVGNSSIKWGLFNQGILVGNQRLDLKETISWEDAWEKFGRDAHKLIMVCGVVPDVLHRHYEWLKSRCSKVKLVTYVDVPVKINLENPGLAGIDRIVASFAALKLAGQNRAVIVVDAGSAVTVDLATIEDGFLGGAIMPGLKLMARSLNQYTAQLPEISVNGQISQVAGTNTAQAISFGVGNAFLGGVDLLVKKLETQAGSQAKLFFTGGDGQLLADHFHSKGDYVPNLVLNGLSLIGEKIANE